MSTDRFGDQVYTDVISQCERFVFDRNDEVRIYADRHWVSVVISACKAAQCHADLLAAAKMGLLFAENGDWATGNTDPTGCIDEGLVLTGQRIAEMRAAIARAEAAQ